MEMMEYGNCDSEIVLVQMVDEHDLEFINKEVTMISELGHRDFLLRAFKVGNWNKDLSPWVAPAVFGNEDFGNGAEKTLAEVLDRCKDNTKKYYIGGYSLAGLFALWSAYRTDIFSGVAAASPSIWFPGFDDYMRTRDINCSRVYLSLGNKEHKARNPVMATVADKIKDAYDILLDKDIESVLEWNEGNHFKEPDVRTAKAFAWVIRENA